MNKIVKPVVLPYRRARRWPLVGNNPSKGVRPPPGFVLLTETRSDGRVQYLTETVNGSTYYLMERA